MERLVVRVQLVVLCRVALARMVLVVAVIWQNGRLLLRGVREETT
jgi:hypothetical protein